MILTLDDITCDKDICIEMRKKGFNQDTLYYRNINTGKVRSLVKSLDTQYIYNEEHYKEVAVRFKEKMAKGIYVAAYTAEELVAILPSMDISTHFGNKGIMMAFTDHNIELSNEMETDEKLCNALARIALRIDAADIENLNKLSESIEKCRPGSNSLGDKK